jgi:hypothetical protein
MSESIDTLAEQALTKPEDFGWHGKEEMFNTWGWSGVTKHRDSDVLQISNYEAIKKDLLSRFPDDFEEVGLGHWAVGHVDCLIVKILKNEKKLIEEENITEAFMAAVEWIGFLEDYAVADDEHFSELCYEETFNTIRDFLPNFILIDESPMDTTASIIEEIIEHSQSDYDEFDFMSIAMNNIGYPERDVIVAAYNLGFIDPEYQSEWNDACDLYGLAAVNWMKLTNPDQLNLFETES